MDWLTKIFSYIKVKVTGDADVSSNHSVKSSKKPIFPEKAKPNNSNDIQMVRELSDKQIQINHHEYNQNSHCLSIIFQ